MTSTTTIADEQTISDKPAGNTEVVPRTIEISETTQTSGINSFENIFSSISNVLNKNGIKKNFSNAIKFLLTTYVKKNHPDAKIPDKAHETDAGYDLYSVEDIVVPSWGKALIDIGISIKLSEETAGLIWSRSGLAVKHDIEVGAGVIDEGYTGPVKVLLRNFSDVDYTVHKGDKIAQMIIHRGKRESYMTEVESLEETDRGDAGFGSSDLKNETTDKKELIPSDKKELIPSDKKDNDDLVFKQSTKITVDGKTTEKVTETKFEDIFTNLFKAFTNTSSSKSLKEPTKTYTTTDPKIYPVTEWWDDQKTIIRTSRTYEGDVLVRIVNYWENSNKKSEENYDATGTEYHGPYLEYYPNGNIKLSCNYQEGYLVDTETEYDESGNTISEKTHKSSSK
jgi:dUTP pyrophosphatase